MRCCIIPIAAHRPTRLRGTTPSAASNFLTQREDVISEVFLDVWRQAGRQEVAEIVGIPVNTVKDARSCSRPEELKDVGHERDQ
jgi:hypothetical protein